VLAPVFDRKAVQAAKVIAKGLPAARSRCWQDVPERGSRGCCRRCGRKGLAGRNETSPEDLRGMIAAEGILTAKAASVLTPLVARQMGKVCVCGAAAMQIDYTAKTMTVDGVTYKEGDFLSINGTQERFMPDKSRRRHRKSSRC